jgi:hypothetical protein
MLRRGRPHGDTGWSLLWLLGPLLLLLVLPGAEASLMRARGARGLQDPTGVGQPVTINTTCGPVVSAPVRLSPLGTPVVPFLGIRYATPMTSELRWTAPTPAPCWNGTYDASQYGSSCVQAICEWFDWAGGGVG